MLKVVEAFSGIGAQKQALENLGIDHIILNTIEWDINAIYAYDVMHHEDLSFSKLSKGEILSKLENVTLSPDGKKPISPKTLKGMNEVKLKRLYAAIIRNKNLCDITQVTGDMISDDIDVLTYSFPCQDLSNGSAWHNSGNEGIKKGANTRSGLLWEIERILKEKLENNSQLPKFLLMENVKSINSAKHNPNFMIWQKELEEMGYVNKVYKELNALNFGIPQSRTRTFMLSVRHPKINEEDISDLDYKIPYNLSKYLRLDNIEEAIEATPNFTPSRKKIRDDNKIIVENGKVVAEFINTISTKQDRNPNAGVILTNNVMRYLTPRETFLLMGFPEEKFDKLLKNNKESKYFSNSHLYRMSGNSIVVDVLEKIFEEIIYLKGRYFNGKLL